MGCIAALVAMVAPRFVLFFMWIFANERMSLAFSSFITGFLGFLLLPYTSVFYVLVYAPVQGVSTFGWFIVFMGLLMDLSSWFGGGREGKKKYA